MRQRTFRLCVCGHRRRVHSGGKCEDCKLECLFKEGSQKNVIPQKGQDSGGSREVNSL